MLRVLGGRPGPSVCGLPGIEVRGYRMVAATEVGTAMNEADSRPLHLVACSYLDGEPPARTVCGIRTDEAAALPFCGPLLADSHRARYEPLVCSSCFPNVAPASVLCDNL